MAKLIELPKDGPAVALYDEALASMNHLYEEVAAGRPVSGAAVVVIMDRLLEALHVDRRTLVSLTSQTPIGNPMVSHAVNTAILTAATAQGLGYAAEHVREAATAALLHDVGLVKLINHGASQELKYDAVKQHAQEALELLDQIPELARLTLYLTPVEVAAHDRARQPALLRRPQVRTVREDELSKVIRLADLYEALTHPRADGSPVAFAAVRTILSTQHLFEPRLMKALFDQVGIYPLGTWVLLSTGEVGLVSGVHEGLPLRPHVMLFYDRTGVNYPEPRNLDLGQHPTVFIKQGLHAEPHPRTRP